MPKSLYLILLTMILTVGCAKDGSNGNGGGGGSASASVPTDKGDFPVLDTSFCSTFKAYTDNPNFDFFFQDVIHTVNYAFVISPSGSYVWDNTQPNNVAGSANGVIFKTDQCTFFLDINGHPAYSDTPTVVVPQTP